ncbi:MAG: hypothetical protein HC860_06090 [Alkalinema sp. RU_4_3]|nr:hypothetical protein [Alkalinema sp. RU_4_3]
MSVNNLTYRKFSGYQRELTPSQDRLAPSSTPTDDASEHHDQAPSLSEITSQLRSIAPGLDVLQQSDHLIKKLSCQMQNLDQRIRQLEHNRLALIRQEQFQKRSQSSSSSVNLQLSSEYPMKNFHSPQNNTLPKIASRVIKLYLLALFGLALSISVSAVIGIPPENGALAVMWDIIWRAGFLLMLFLGTVAVQQSVH